MNRLRRKEMEHIPWWARIWRYDPVKNYAYILPMPLCWVARLSWNLWCWSYRMRPNRFEREINAAYQAGVRKVEEDTREDIVEMFVEIV